MPEIRLAQNKITHFLLYIRALTKTVSATQTQSSKPMRHYGHCKQRNARPPIDYSARLDTMINLMNRILTEVANHQVTVLNNPEVQQVDLNPVLDELRRILSEVQNITTNIQSTADMLLAQFLAVIASIDDFKSAALLSLSSLKEEVIKEGNETQDLLRQILAKTPTVEPITECDGHPYEFIILAGNTGGVFRIPEGTLKLSVVNLFCEAMVINGMTRPTGMQIGNELSVVGNKVFTDGVYEIQMEANHEIAVSWMALEDLGDIQIISGDLIFEKAIRYPRTRIGQPVINDLQPLIDLTSSETLT
jgi:hypothetical protein